MEMAIMDPEKIFGSFVAGIVISLFTNALFPEILAMTIENTQSLPLHVRLVFLLLPFAIFVAVAHSGIESIEAVVAGVIGFLFSVFVLESVGIAEFVVAMAIIGFIVYKIQESRE